MHEYHVIKQKLLPVFTDAGLREVVADRSLDVCGSIHSIFASDAARIMLGWDGEEGFGYVEAWEGNNLWRVLDSKVPEGAAAEFESDLETLSQVLSQHLRATVGGAP